MAGDQPRVMVAEMAALLTKRAPNLCPNVAPRQYKMAVSNVLSICATPQQRADAQAFLASKAGEISHDHEQENGEEDEEQVRTDGEKGRETHVVLKTETDFGTRTFRIASAKVTIVCRTSAAAQLHQHYTTTAPQQQQLNGCYCSASACVLLVVLPPRLCPLGTRCISPLRPNGRRGNLRAYTHRSLLSLYNN